MIQITDAKLKEFLMKDGLISEADFARIVGVDRNVISRLCTRDVLIENHFLRTWIIQIISYYKGLAAGVRGSGY